MVSKLNAHMLKHGGPASENQNLRCKSHIETEVTHAEFLHEIISRIYLFETQDFEKIKNVDFENQECQFEDFEFFEKSRMSISKIKTVNFEISKIKKVDFGNHELRFQKKLEFRFRKIKFYYSKNHVFRFWIHKFGPR